MKNLTEGNQSESDESLKVATSPEATQASPEENQSASDESLKLTQVVTTSPSLTERIYAAVRLIPRGKVASYSQIAALMGNKNLRRYVGNVLHKNPSNDITPCHRVVNARGKCSGSFAFGGENVQRDKLEAEGVVFIKDHVDMESCGISDDDFQEMSARLKVFRAFKSLFFGI